MDCQSAVIWGKSSSKARLTLKFDSFTALNLGRREEMLKLKLRHSFLALNGEREHFLARKERFNLWAVAENQPCKQKPHEFQR